MLATFQHQMPLSGTAVALACGWFEELRAMNVLVQGVTVADHASLMTTGSPLFSAIWVAKVITEIDFPAEQDIGILAGWIDAYAACQAAVCYDCGNGSARFAASLKLTCRSASDRKGCALPAKLCVGRVEVGDREYE